uniref:Uncharacterized protein n=1 Tax=Heterorhabditis bacteriophora TaxID=37862 RepID=A0A1I7WNQ8_HETBA
MSLKIQFALLTVRNILLSNVFGILHLVFKRKKLVCSTTIVSGPDNDFTS